VKLLLWLIALILLLPFVLGAVDREIVELKRDVELLNQDMREMQRSMDEHMGAMTTLLKQTLNRVNDIHTTNAVTQTTLNDRLRRQEQTVAQPVTALGSKMDRVASDSLVLKEGLADLNARLKRLELKLVDVENAVRVIHAPPPPPSVSEALGGPPCGVTAEGLFQSALRDQLAGNSDLALQQFQDFVTYFGDTELAVSSHFHIGEISFYNGDLKPALAAFDLVVERYPRSGKAPDSLYLKAKVLQKQGLRKQALRELNRVVNTYPNSDAARRARRDLAKRSGTRASKSSSGS
jgi:TolA-binding protein